MSVTFAHPAWLWLLAAAPLAFVIARASLADFPRRQLAVQATVEHGSSPDTETAMLISLLLAGGVLHQVQPTTDCRAQILRVQHLVQDNWVAAATRKTLQDNGAVAAGLVDLPGFLGS